MPVCAWKVDASLGEPRVTRVLSVQTLVDVLASSGAQRILISGRAGGQSGQTLEATFLVCAVLMQIEPTVVQVLGALVDVQASAVEDASEAATAERCYLANEGPVCVDASVNSRLRAWKLKKKNNNITIKHMIVI